MSKTQWEPFTTEDDRKKGYNLCPKCKADLNVLVEYVKDIDPDNKENVSEESYIIAEGCSKGCYTHSFEE